MRILVVEDELDIAQFLSQGLTEAGYVVDLAHDGIAAGEYCLAAEYSLILLDIMLPKLDGLQLLRQIRSRSIHTPVMLLTARDAVSDRITGLDAGADDYLVKPFAFSELLARLRALLRRPPVQVDLVLQLGDVQMDIVQREVRCGARSIDLAPREFHLLEYLQATFDKEKRFTADASHELRTPLTAIKGRIGMILSQPRSTVQYAATLAQVETQVDRLIRLTKDLLLLSRLDDKRSSWQLTSIDLSDLLAATVEQIQPLAAEKGLELIAEIQPQLTIQCEPDYLIGICLNLLDNAIKYTPKSGQISLRAYTQTDGIRIVVSDTGVGIDPQYLPHLFDRFYRVNSDRARASGGTGLGLAIASEVVRLHGGSLSVTSQIDSPQETLRVGGACALRLRGTTFTIVLPQQ